MKKIILVVLILLMVTSVFSEIIINGDARVRPRLDLINVEDNDEKTETRDLYYMYWARLWVTAKLTEGWYFQTKLATDGPANWIGKFGGSSYGQVDGWTEAVAAHSDGRGVVRFAEAHFGRNTDQYGWSMGILPMSGLGNPEYDLHFYPMSTSDLPYTILNSASAGGFRGYYMIGENRLNVTLTVDEDQVQYSYSEYEDEVLGTVETETEQKDFYSIFVDYQMTFGDYKVRPTLIYSLSDDDYDSPLTLGANLGLPSLAGFGLSAGGYYTIQNHDDNIDVCKYSGPMVHLKATKKIGPGNFAGWVDWKSIKYEDEDDATNTTLLWLMYKYTVYKSEIGTFWMAPTYRLILQNYGDMEYNRHKIELTLHLSFK